MSNKTSSYFIEQNMFSSNDLFGLTNTIIRLLYAKPTISTLPDFRFIVEQTNSFYNENIASSCTFEKQARQQTIKPTKAECSTIIWERDITP
ncbi:hypothetical protein [Prevotella pallens]